MNRLTIDDINRDLEIEKKSAEIITEDVFATLREFKQAGIGPRELAETLSALDNFANHATKTLGVVNRKGNPPPSSPEADSGAAGGGRDEPPIAKKGGGGDNGDMENRVKSLETGMIDVRERLVRIETRLDGMPTKADLSDTVHGQTKWLIVSMFGMFAVAMAVAKLMF